MSLTHQNLTPSSKVIRGNPISSRSGSAGRMCSARAVYLSEAIISFNHGMGCGGDKYSRALRRDEIKIVERREVVEYEYKEGVTQEGKDVIVYESSMDTAISTSDEIGLFRFETSFKLPA